MNEIVCNLKEIKSKDNINLLTFEKDNNLIQVLILQMNVGLKLGDKAVLYIKPTKIFLSKEKYLFDNVLPVNILDIRKGEIVSLIKAKFIDSVFEVVMLNEYINFEKKAFMLFKASDISIRKKID
ncbi:hypothetical protein [Caminibacter mediatlanticus]|uniref:Molybdenum-pterin-binding protein n=1 Tax=Caminibacter mediatlanticus TB-2 TaxID=391592 RepID=A0AAI9F2N9_9BACT|nr:hypothetical protein [Caminibacter mediatlanticus]EDM24004.1 hypothetical protein CMTB2_07111 [Caminibacter mediatlanticus TB-2]